MATPLDLRDHGLAVDSAAKEALARSPVGRNGEPRIPGKRELERGRRAELTSHEFHGKMIAAEREHPVLRRLASGRGMLSRDFGTPPMLDQLDGGGDGGERITLFSLQRRAAKTLRIFLR